MKKEDKALNFLGLLAILSCFQSAAASTSFVPLIIGEDFVVPFGENDLFRGFKKNVAEGESAFRAKPFKGRIESRPFATEFVTSEVVMGSQSLTDSMEIEGSVSVSFGPLRGSGAGEFLKKQVRSRNSVTIVYSRRSAAFASSVLVDHLEISDELKELTGGVPTSAHEPLIASEYGTQFVDQVLYGSQLDLRYTVTSEEDIDIQEIEAQLKGRIGFGPLSVSFNRKFERRRGSEKSQYQLSIEAMATGINFQVPSNPSFDEANDLITEFNAEYHRTITELEKLENVDDESNILKVLTPVGLP